MGNIDQGPLIRYRRSMRGTSTDTDSILYGELSRSQAHSLDPTDSSWMPEKLDLSGTTMIDYYEDSDGWSGANLSWAVSVR